MTRYNDSKKYDLISGAIKHVQFNGLAVSLNLYMVIYVDIIDKM